MCNEKAARQIVARGWTESRPSIVNSKRIQSFHREFWSKWKRQPDPIHQEMRKCRSQMNGWKRRSTATPSVTDVEWTLTADECGAKSATCLLCQKTGNYACMCFKKRRKTQTDKNSDKSRDRNKEKEKTKLSKPVRAVLVDALTQIQMSLSMLLILKVLRSSKLRDEG